MNLFINIKPFTMVDIAPNGDCTLIITWVPIPNSLYTNYHSVCNTSFFPFTYLSCRAWKSCPTCPKVISSSLSEKVLSYTHFFYNSFVFISLSKFCIRLSKYVIIRINLPEVSFPLERHARFNSLNFSIQAWYFYEILY